MANPDFGIWGNLQADIVQLLNDSDDLKVYDDIPDNAQYPILMVDSWDVDARSGADKNSKKWGDGTFFTLTLISYTGGKHQGYLTAINMIEDAICIIADGRESISGDLQFTADGGSAGRGQLPSGENVWTASASLRFYIS